MGIFSWSKNEENKTVGQSHVNVNGENLNSEVKLPKDIFTEESEPNLKFKENNSIDEGNGIKVIYNFLLDDYKNTGYGDAIENPDQSNRAKGINRIKFELKIRISKELNYYTNKINELDFLIVSRERAGLIDLVDELKSKQEQMRNDIKDIKEIEEDMIKNKGTFERIITTYEQGFSNGISSLTLAKIIIK